MRGDERDPRRDERDRRRGARDRRSDERDRSTGQQRIEWSGRLVALAILALLSLYTLSQNSVVIDGSRIFWLDDDQMISMRYARNLAEGQGLVWNPGERVEGYTNFLWTLVMAGAHLLPLGDGWTAVPVALLNLLLAALVLWLSERLLRILLGRGSPGAGRARAEEPGNTVSSRIGLPADPRLWAVPVLWITLALCMDLVYWSANGFETTLLTVLFLAVVVRFLEASGAAGPGTYLLLGLLALVRSDALVVWAAAAIVGLGTAWIGPTFEPMDDSGGSRRRESRERKVKDGGTLPDPATGEREIAGKAARRHRIQRTGLGLGASLALPAAHFLFRFLYYGSLLPNTYYLKVAGMATPWSQGLGYLQAFVGDYGVPLALGVVGVPLSGDRRRWLLLGALALDAVYVVRVGGDIFHHARFLAHFVPVVLALGVAGILDLGTTGASHLRRAGSLDSGGAGSLGRDRGRTPRARAVPSSPTRMRLTLLVLLLLLLLLSGSVLLQAGVYPLEVLVPVNGDPRSGAIVGTTIRLHTAPDASVAVVAAGNVPYFGRRRAVDLLGKNDPRIARQPPRCCPEALGHNKFDPEYSFGLEPDLVVLLWPHGLVARYIDGFTSPTTSPALADIRKFWRGPAFARSRPFREHYFPNPVPVPSLLQWDAIYVREGSPEIEGLDRWEAPRIRGTGADAGSRS